MRAIFSLYCLSKQWFYNIYSYSTSLVNFTNKNFFDGPWTWVITGSDAQTREHARGPLIVRKKTEYLQERTKEIHFLPRTPLKLAAYYSPSKLYADNEIRETNNEHNMSFGLISLVFCLVASLRSGGDFHFRD